MYKNLIDTYRGEGVEKLENKLEIIIIKTENARRSNLRQNNTNFV